jgi:hypothetical protein
MYKQMLDSLYIIRAHESYCKYKPFPCPVHFQRLPWYLAQALDNIGRLGGRYPQGKISGMWYYPPLSPACLEIFGEGSITCRKSYLGDNALPVSLCSGASCADQCFYFERYIALVRRFGPVQAGPSKFKPTQWHHLAVTVPKQKRWCGQWHTMEFLLQVLQWSPQIELWWWPSTTRLTSGGDMHLVHREVHEVLGEVFFCTTFHGELWDRKLTYNLKVQYKSTSS